MPHSNIACAFNSTKTILLYKYVSRFHQMGICVLRLFVSSTAAIVFWRTNHASQYFIARRNHQLICNLHHQAPPFNYCASHCNYEIKKQNITTEYESTKSSQSLIYNRMQNRIIFLFVYRSNRFEHKSFQLLISASYRYISTVLWAQLHETTNLRNISDLPLRLWNSQHFNTDLQ